MADYTGYETIRFKPASAIDGVSDRVIVDSGPEWVMVLKDNATEVINALAQAGAVEINGKPTLDAPPQP
jgi:hypothetical protein